MSASNFPPLAPEDLTPLYKKEKPEDLCSSDVKHYPGQNQAQFCWQKYNEYVHCLKMNKRDEAECARFKGFYSQVCPNEWTSTWDEQRAAGVFPGVQLDPLPGLVKKHH